MNGEPWEPEKNTIKCSASACSNQANLSINILCEKCSRPLLKLNWLHFLVFVFSLSAAGFVINYFKNLWLPSLYAQLLLLLYVLLILRRESSARNFSIFLIFLSFPLAFLRIHGSFGISYLDYSYLTIIVITIVYLFSCYFITWRKACIEHDTTLIKGFSTISFTLFLLVIATDFFVNQLGIEILSKEFQVFGIRFTISKVVSLPRRNIKIREILLVITIIQIMFLALVNTVRNNISRPKNLFKPETSINLLDISHRNTILSAIFRVVQTVVNISLHFYKITTEIMRAILNTIKRVIEYILKFVRNYAYEILKLIRSFIVIFLKTNFHFLKDYVIPLILFFILALQVNFLIDHISHYVNTGQFTNSLAFYLNILAIFVEIIILIWLLTEYKLRQTLDSIAVNNIWFVFTLIVSILISSWFLWVLSQVLSKLTFGQIGGFTKYGSIALVLTIIVLFFVTYIIQKRREA